MANKIDLGQPLRELNGEAVRMSAVLDSRTLAVVAQALAALPAEVRTPAVEAINKQVAKPLTLSVAITSALTAVFEDESKPGQLAGPERIARFDLARRCNKEGMVKLDGAQVKKCSDMVTKYFAGSLIAPQAEMLLQGKAFDLTIEDDADTQQSTE